MRQKNVVFQRQVYTSRFFCDIIIKICSESPLRCTTSPTRTSTARTPGPHSTQRTSRARTTEPAPPTARCISKMKIKSSVRETGRNFFVASQSFLIFQSRSPRINGIAERSELSATGRVYSMNRSVIRFEYLPSSLGIPPFAIKSLSAAVSEDENLTTA